MLLKNRGVRQCITARGVAQIENHVWSFRRIGGIIGQQNASTCRMMNKKTAAQGFGVALATPLAIGATAVAYKAWPQLHVSLILIFIGLWAGLFKTVVWVFTRELPVTGAERRRRNKQFYDWLRSQGRR